MSYDQAPPPPPPGEYGNSQGGGFNDPNAGGYNGPPAKENNTKAIVAVVCSVLGLCCGILSIVGIVLGVLGFNEAKKMPGRDQQRTLSIVAIAVGALTLVINVVYGIVRISN